ncbi:MAG: hypothetical protein ACRD4L_10570 [Pyrinomonadaceae bacterium]
MLLEEWASEKYLAACTTSIAFAAAQFKIRLNLTFMEVTINESSDFSSGLLRAKFYFVNGA